MAHLKDLIVSGVSRFLGTVYAKLFKGDLDGTASNADKLDGYHANEFLMTYPKSGAADIDNTLEAGTYIINYKCTGFPTEYGNWGILDVRVYGSTISQTITFTDGDYIMRRIQVNNGGWNPWRVMVVNWMASNPNLLINPDFKINQRGLMSYTNSGYTVDRWYKPTDKVLAEVTGYGIKLTYKGTSTNCKWITQMLEKTYTGTFSFSCFIRKSRSDLDLRISIGSSDSTSSVYNKYFTDTSGTNFTCITTLASSLTNINEIAFITDRNLSAGDWIEIQWMKLEMGVAPTQFVPPDPAAELTKCRMYYKEIRGVYPVSVVTSNEIQVPVTNEALNMIRMPNTYFKNSTEFNTVYGVRIINNVGTTVSGFTFSTFMSPYEDIPYISATKTSHGLNRTTCFMFMGNKNWLCLDAEIYPSS